MNGTERAFFTPTLWRYLVREFARVFMLALVAFICIYVLGDFFDRFDTFLRHEAAPGAVARYYLFKLPLILTQVVPMAALAGALIALGLLARGNEFVAMRACGVSIYQMAAPLLAVGALLSSVVFAWNETVVPYSCQRWHRIYSREIKHKRFAGVFSGHEVWYHGRAGFYNIGRIAGKRRKLYGLTIYQVDRRFRPTRVIEADTAVWTSSGWRLENPRVMTLDEGGKIKTSSHLPDNFRLPEKLDDFRVVSREPEELSRAMLARQIRDLRRRGIDTSPDLVDLHLKIALPAATLVMLLLAVPLATRLGPASLAASAGLGLLCGFAYYFVVAFARALGQAGALPPTVAAWAGNAIFALVGLFFLLGGDEAAAAHRRG